MNNLTFEIPTICIVPPVKARGMFRLISDVQAALMERQKGKSSLRFALALETTESSSSALSLSRTSSPSRDNAENLHNSGHQYLLQERHRILQPMPVPRTELVTIRVLPPMSVSTPRPSTDNVPPSQTPLTYVLAPAPLTPP